MPTIRRLEPGTDPTQQTNIPPGRNYKGLVILFAIVLACGLAAFFGSRPTLALVTGKKGTPTPTVTLMSPELLTPSRTPTGTAGLTLPAITPSPTLAQTETPDATPQIFVTVIHDQVVVTREVAVQVTSVVKVIMTQLVPVTVMVTSAATKTPRPTATLTPTATQTPPVLTAEPTEPPEATPTPSDTPTPSQTPTETETEVTEMPTATATDIPTQETGD
jgi:hypothetical protein